MMSVWLALGWPGLVAPITGRGSPASALWLIPFTIFGAAALGAAVPKLRPRIRWPLLCVQVAAVVAMAILNPRAMMSIFLIITAWQVAMATTPLKAVSWVMVQMLAVVAALALAPIPDLGSVLAASFGLQLLLVFTAYALQWEEETAQALARTNRELTSARDSLARTVRDAERLHISRELHDTWGHELTALALQLEIASHLTGPGEARDHVVQAKGLVRSLFTKVRNVVAMLRESESLDLKELLDALARSVSAPAVHVRISPDVRVSPEQAHTFVRCAQDAVVHAIEDPDASNLWIQVTRDAKGVRLIARGDGRRRTIESSPGSRLLGMRDRVERLGGKLAVGPTPGFGVTFDAWLPSRTL